MSKELVHIFNFNDVEIRTVERSGDIWFVAADVAKVLDIGRASDAVSGLDDDEKGTDTIRTPGGLQQMTVVNESGLYSMVLVSRKAEAKRFKKWITSEVLPAIRKTGHYASRKHQRPEMEATPIFKEYFNVAKLIGLDRNQAAFAANAAAKKMTGADPLALMGVTHLLAPVQDVVLNPSELGKELGVSNQKVNRLLAEKGLQKHVGGKWTLTEEGKKYGRLFDTNKTRGGVPIMQLKWYASVLPLLGGNQELFKEAA